MSEREDLAAEAALCVAMLARHAKLISEDGRPLCNPRPLIVAKELIERLATAVRRKL